jgi:hypothetical protein
MAEIDRKYICLGKEPVSMSEEINEKVITHQPAAISESLMIYD